jgi:hypothetical protein
MPGIVEGRKWLQARLAFLQEALDAGPPDDQRKAIEDEIAAVRDELRRHGPLHWLRFLHHSTDL